MTTHCGTTEWAIQKDVDYWERGNIHLSVECPHCESEDVEVEQRDSRELTEGLIIFCRTCNTYSKELQPALGLANACDCGDPRIP